MGLEQEVGFIVDDAGRDHTNVRFGAHSDPQIIAFATSLENLAIATNQGGIDAVTAGNSERFRQRS